MIVRFVLTLDIVINRHMEELAAAFQLTLEQQFKLEALKNEVKTLSKEQAQEYLFETFRQLMIKDNLMRQIMKENL